MKESELTDREMRAEGEAWAKSPEGVAAIESAAKALMEALATYSDASAELQFSELREWLWGGCDTKTSRSAGLRARKP